MADLQPSCDVELALKEKNNTLDKSTLDIYHAKKELLDETAWFLNQSRYQYNVRYFNNTNALGIIYNAFMEVLQLPKQNIMFCINRTVDGYLAIQLGEMRDTVVLITEILTPDFGITILNVLVHKYLIRNSILIIDAARHACDSVDRTNPFQFVPAYIYSKLREAIDSNDELLKTALRWLASLLQKDAVYPIEFILQ